jgi:Core-2/I-Branching enzyme
LLFFLGGKMIQYPLVQHHADSAMLKGKLAPITPKRKEISIAYFILLHRFPEQFKRLFKAIYHPNNHYLIHVDRKSSTSFFNEIEMFLRNFPNTYLMESKNVVWGGYSMVQSELDGMNYLLGLNLNWDFFINLSGQDFPLKSQAYIHDFLAMNSKSSFLKIADQATERPDTMNRVENYFEKDDTGFPKMSYKRRFLRDVTPYIGGQWMILTRDCCEFICKSSEVKRFEDFYLHTLIADESFFQTVIMNTSFSGTIINDDKRAIIWIPDGTIKLRPKTFTKADLDFLLTGDNLFARKFDENVDSSILRSLESSMMREHNFSENIKSASLVG